MVWIKTTIITTPFSDISDIVVNLKLYGHVACLPAFIYLLITTVKPRYTVHSGGNGKCTVCRNARYIEFSNLRDTIGTKRVYSHNCYQRGER